MKTEDIYKFYSTQNKILLKGGVLSLITMTFGLLHSIMAIVGGIVLCVTFLICDFRESQFKKKGMKP